ncbi:MAG: PAS domain S-box protein [Coleofasciculus sp. Co-bin14]|nr:PAS domain S-box protein [Coleofasciculus sp. Co-bin14]
MRYVLSRGRAVFNQAGQVVKLFGTAQDITERKKAEEELRESEAKFRQLAENIREVFFILDKTGQMIYISPTYEQVWGRTPESLYQNPRSWLESVHPEQQPQMAAALDRQIRYTAEFDETYRIVRPDGEIRWIRARSFPIQYQKSYRFVGIAEDITTSKQAEETLQQAKQAAEAANQAKSAFLANMSHELRTPLNAILGFSQLLNRSSSLPPEHKKNLGTIIRSGEHLLSLINQILDLSKIEAGRTTLNETGFDLYHFLDELKDMFQLEANHQGLQLRFELSPEVPQYVRTDEVKLRQVLINLLSNAMKFTSEGSVSLRVGLGARDWGLGMNVPNYPLHFEIEDTGAGIAPEELESIFEAFVQTKTGQQYQEGTGLGLTITRKFVELMGGTISINSQVGKGTVVTFDIKASAVEAACIETKLPSRRVIALEANQPSYRILIVDDRTDNRQVLIELLSPLGFELKEASNGLEAIEIWDTWEPHLIFIDMRMPLMDGYEATKRIKAITKGQATAIVAVTASSLEEQRATILSAGCEGFIRKPFRDAEIFDALHNHIQVRFVYEEPTAVPVKTEIGTDISIPIAFTTLPPDLVADFHNALQELDVELIQTSIAQIRELNEPLANALAVFTNDFQYEQLLNLIPPLRG